MKGGAGPAMIKPMLEEMVITDPDEIERRLKHILGPEAGKFMKADRPELAEMPHFLGDPVVALAHNKAEAFLMNVVKGIFPNKLMFDSKAAKAWLLGYPMWAAQAEPFVLRGIDGINGRRHARVFKVNDWLVFTAHKDTPIPHRQDPEGTRTLVAETRRALAMAREEERCRRLGEVLTGEDFGGQQERPSLVLAPLVERGEILAWTTQPHTKGVDVVFFLAKKPDLKEPERLWKRPHLRVFVPATSGGFGPGAIPVVMGVREGDEEASDLLRNIYREFVRSLHDKAVKRDLTYYDLMSVLYDLSPHETAPPPPPPEHVAAMLSRIPWHFGVEEGVAIPGGAIGAMGFLQLVPLGGSLMPEQLAEFVESCGGPENARDVLWENARNLAKACFASLAEDAALDEGLTEEAAAMAMGMMLQTWNSQVAPETGLYAITGRVTHLVCKTEEGFQLVEKGKRKPLIPVEEICEA